MKAQQNNNTNRQIQIKSKPIYTTNCVTKTSKTSKMSKTSNTSKSSKTSKTTKMKNTSPIFCVTSKITKKGQLSQQRQQNQLS